MLEKDSRLEPEEYAGAEHLPVRLIIEDVRSGNNVPASISIDKFFNALISE